MSKKEKKRSTNLRTLWYFWQEMRKRKAAVLVCAILAVLVELIQAIFFAYAIAQVLDIVASGESGGRVQELTAWVAAALGAYAVAQIIFRRVGIWILWKLELKVKYETAQQVFEKLSYQSMNFHNNKFAGSLVSQANKYIGAFEEFFDILIFSILPFVTIVTFSTILLWQIMPAIALIVVGAVLMFLVAALICVKVATPIQDAEIKAENKQTGQLADSMTNMLTVKSYGHEKYEQRRFAKVSHNVFVASLKNLRFHTVRDVIFSLVFLAINATVIIFVAFGNLWFGIGVGALVLVYSYSTTISGWLWEITRMIRHINRAFSNAHEMVEILDGKAKVLDAPNAVDLDITKGAVHYANIAYRHENARAAIFRNFDLKIKPGQRVGLVGVSGSGKTTLTKLLLRFDDVQSGEILVDGQNIAKVRQESLRRKVAYVPQEPMLFHRSIRDNIAYGKLDATDKEVEEAAKQANAYEFIKNELPNGFETLVGERGVKLSGGQRQRVAIARAILRNAPILILDEATSALDSDSEKLIQAALGNLMKDRTAIVIAHRLSTVAHLDRIIVLRDGKIIEDGKHRELLVKDGTYAKLWKKQTEI
ncbi:ABC transporter ATP-binding protein/permease [Candidatus Saccharibacteria bacterium]|nr:ABC transporter ATP-binding protein/permease [Candidatus Saccharibacteria bacterium]